MPANTTHPSGSDSIISLNHILVLLGIMSVLGISSYLFIRYQSPHTKTAVVKPTESPPYPLAQGKQTYTFSHGKDVKGPLPRTVVIDPYDPKLNESQTISIHITHTDPVIEASIVLESDHAKTPPHPLTRVSGSDTDGIWETTHTITDTHDHVYNLWIDIKSRTSSFYNKLTFRAY